jgi:hypothetical protein
MGLSLSTLRFFFVEPLEICYGALVFLLSDGKKLYCALFDWNACVEERDKFGANIIKIKDKVRL